MRRSNGQFLTKDLQQTHEIAQIVAAALQKRGFVIAPEKIQVQYPFMFLGFQLEPATVHSQKLAIQMSHLKTLKRGIEKKTIFNINNNFEIALRYGNGRG